MKDDHRKEQGKESFWHIVQGSWSHLRLITASSSFQDPFETHKVPRFEGIVEIHGFL